MILALKTNGAVSWWALLDTTGEQLGQWEWESGRELADGLLGRLVDSLDETRAASQDRSSSLSGPGAQPFRTLSGIIVFDGPGSFTSLRIGHTVANALADGLAIPVVGAVGDEWIAVGLAALATAQTGTPALPLYGAEPNVKPPQA